MAALLPVSLGSCFCLRMCLNPLEKHTCNLLPICGSPFPSSYNTEATRYFLLCQQKVEFKTVLELLSFDPIYKSCINHTILCRLPQIPIYVLHKKNNLISYYLVLHSALCNSHNSFRQSTCLHIYICQSGEREGRDIRFPQMQFSR